MLDLNFKEFLNEAIRPGTLNNALSYGDRVAQGRAVERDIRAKMAENGIITIDSTAVDDMVHGIDGYIVSTDGGKTKMAHTAFQLKLRKNTSGNDILWETIKPWREDIKTYFEDWGDSAFTGKDMRCKAKVLISLGNNGQTLRVRKIDETIEIAKKMATMFVEQFRGTGSTKAVTPWGEALLVVDPSSEASRGFGQARKLNCFIREGAYSWKKDVKLMTPILAL